MFGYDPEFQMPLLYKVDPSGHYMGYFATAAGVKGQEAMSTLEKRFKKSKFEECSLDDIVEIALSCLANVLSVDLKADDVEMAVLSKDQPTMKVLSNDEIEVYLNLMAERE